MTIEMKLRPWKYWILTQQLVKGGNLLIDIESEFFKINELAEYILRNGQINPVLIRLSDDKDFKYELFAGSRRWEACLLVFHLKQFW